MDKSRDSERPTRSSAKSSSSGDVATQIGVRAPCVGVRMNGRNRIETTCMRPGRARIPAGFAPEATIAEYRAALERHAIETSAWWDRQLPLSLLGIMVLLGWEKALGPGDNLAWWSARVLEGAELL